MEIRALRLGLEEFPGGGDSEGGFPLGHAKFQREVEITGAVHMEPGGESRGGVLPAQPLGVHLVPGAGRAAGEVGVSAKRDLPAGGFGGERVGQA